MNLIGQRSLFLFCIAALPLIAQLDFRPKAPFDPTDRSECSQLGQAWSEYLEKLRTRRSALANQILAKPYDLRQHCRNCWPEATSCGNVFYQFTPERSLAFEHQCGMVSWREEVAACEAKVTANDEKREARLQSQQHTTSTTPSRLSRDSGRNASVPNSPTSALSTPRSSKSSSRDPERELPIQDRITLDRARAFGQLGDEYRSQAAAAAVSGENARMQAAATRFRIEQIRNVSGELTPDLKEELSHLDERLSARMDEIASSSRLVALLGTARAAEANLGESKPEVIDWAKTWSLRAALGERSETIEAAWDLSKEGLVVASKSSSTAERLNYVSNLVTQLQAHSNAGGLRTYLFQESIKSINAIGNEMLGSLDSAFQRFDSSRGDDTGDFADIRSEQIAELLPGFRTVVPAMRRVKIGLEAVTKLLGETP